MNGERVGPYTLVRLLGEGAFGTVHLAQDAHGSRCAIKQLKAEAASAEARAAFERELAVGKRPISPMVARVLDFDLTVSRPWIAMEYAEGRTLAEVLQREGPMDNGRARRIALQLAQGLQALHAQGLVHRDVKPDNIRIGLNDSVKIVDLGFARETDSGVSRIAGTPRYMAPEAVTGAVGSYTDIYAFGVIVTELLIGRCPTGGPDQVLAAIPAPWLPFLRDTVSANFGQRPSADRLVAALDSSQAAAPAQRPVLHPAPQPPRHSTPAGPQLASAHQTPAPAPPHQHPATPVRQAYAVAATGTRPERDYATTAGLAAFAGWLGAHRFSVGKIGTGILQLFTFGGLGWWWLYDVWALHTGRFRDAAGRPLTGRPPAWYVVSAVAAFLSLFYIAANFEEDDGFWLIVGSALLLATIGWSIDAFRKQRSGDERSLSSLRSRSSAAGPAPDRSRILREARVLAGEGNPGPYPVLHQQMTAWASRDAARRAGRPTLAAHGLPVRPELHGVLGAYSAHMLRTYEGEVPREIQFAGTSVRATWRPTSDGILVSLPGSDLLDPADRLDGLQQLELAALGFRAPTARIPRFHFEVTDAADVPAAAGALVLALSGVLGVDDAALLGSAQMLEFVDGFGDDSGSVLRA